MGTVVEFKRPEPKPADPLPEEWRSVSVDQFDECTRNLAAPDVSKEDILDFFDRWRKAWGLEPLMTGGAT